MARHMDGGGPQAGRASEEALAVRLRALDHDAWACAYDDHHPRLWRYIYARTGSQDLADDIAAQVFVEALASIGRYRYDEKPIVAWLYGIARRHISKRRRADRLPRFGTLVQPAEDLLERRLLSITLGEALRALTQDQRDVVLLRYFGEYSTREIAAALRRSAAAVYSLEERALKRLRRVIGKRTDFDLPLATKTGTSRV